MLKNTIIFLLIFPISISAQQVIEDNGIKMSEEEISIAIKHWPSNIREEATHDTKLRKDYLEQIFAAKKIAQKANKISLNDDPDFFWQKTFGIRSILKKIYTERFKKQLQTPDMQKIAHERFVADKEKYSAIPETRLSSHILFRCETDECTLSGNKKLAEEVLKKLLSGESFEKMVEKHSKDPGTKKKKGRLEQWIARGQPHVIGEYTQGVFLINKIGEYSNIIQSKFGFHIIRLDGVKEKKYRSFEKVKANIISSLEKEYEKLALTNFYKQFNFSKNVKINEELLDKIFEKYKK